MIYIHGMTPAVAPVVPTILFGAFDRHNFGDLLFPHIAAALLDGRHPLFAGLAERDLRRYGGHRVRALAQLAAEWGGRPVRIIHAGGELLTCEAWQAAVMLLTPARAEEAIAQFDRQPQARQEWARRQLGIAALAPYTMQNGVFPGAAGVIYNAVGGVELGACEPELRAEVLANLKAANAVSVRERLTLAQLRAAGIAARLVPDPAVMVAELFGATIRQHTRGGAVAQILAAFPQGYLAVQFSADFGDDATLAEIASQLELVARSTGYGLVFFRAGAAPWHDDLDCYRRVAAGIAAPALKLFTSLDLWDICALIAYSRGYCGSSLHGRIVAMAYAQPRLNLTPSGQAGRAAKQAAYAATWEPAGMPGAVDAHQLAQGILAALATDPGQRRQTAGKLVAEYREGFAAMLATLK